MLLKRSSAAWIVRRVIGCEHSVCRIPASQERVFAIANSVLKPLLCAGALAIAASPAYAVLKISANVNGASFTCADQQICDTDPTVGSLGIVNGTLAGVMVQGSLQEQDIAAG